LGIYAATILVWGLLAGVALWHEMEILRRQAESSAWERARMLFDIIETTRLWNARHGGVYVPTTEATPPNPYLDVPDRDFEALGRKFTMVNPAYMTRQVAELVEKRQGVTFNITSLKPIRPDNRADPWETRALERFEAGETEVLEKVDGHAPPSYRYMAALQVREPCLKCHRKQGYEVGDIRGGISVTIPAAAILAAMAPQKRQTLLVYLSIFLVGSLGTIFFLTRLRANWLALEAVRARQEEVIAARTAELQRSNQELEHFAYVASHDLREPLRMISSYAGLLQKRLGDRLEGDNKEFMGYLTDGATRLQAMITDLLDYSRVDRTQMSFSAVEMSEVLVEALSNLQIAIEECDAEVTHDAMPRVKGHPLLLVRLLQNLIGNAIKYRAPERRPLVHVSAERKDGFWTFCVRDNGIGIPADSHDRVFQIFQRLHPRSAYPGTGIGLAVCRRIVEHHGGKIWLESKEDEGSTFYFTLPAL
jgi:signal transduction histidine kinase